MRMDRLCELKGLFPVASIVVPIAEVTNLQAWVVAHIISQLTAVDNEAVAIATHVLQEGSIRCTALHDILDSARTCEVGEALKKEGIAFGIGDVAERVGIVARTEEGVAQIDPRSVATEILKSVGSDGSSVTTVDDGSCTLLGEALLHLFVAKNAFLHNLRNTTVAGKLHQLPQAVAIHALVLKLVFFLNGTNLEQTSLDGILTLGNFLTEIDVVLNAAPANKQQADHTKRQKRIKYFLHDVYMKLFCYIRIAKIEQII